jgi:hypothetical protein
VPQAKLYVRRETARGGARVAWQLACCLEGIITQLQQHYFCPKKISKGKTSKLTRASSLLQHTKIIL